ncbi:MAG: hypothetical protein CME70_07060 [Halobacteriovorax sp.]|nr:hypothetical protein [Halobacteriovorax sp.]|tara:strand:- start:430651 stop:432270 length:1620 start_codon:yes stop_codon:yes gene_type:complete
MSNVLFVNLKRNGDIFNTAALAHSYLKEHPHATPYILTYDEFKKATKPLSVFKGVFTLDRKKLTTFNNHNLYSNGFALDELLCELKGIESIVWSDIINYSSDRASTFLCNYLQAATNANIKGVSFGKYNNIDYKSNWEVVFNEVITNSNLSPVHFSTAYHGMLGVSENTGSYSIKRIKKHDDTVENNFTSLKKNNSAKGANCSLVGIQLSTSLDSKNWDSTQITKLIESVLDDYELYPLILIAPSDEERALSREINEKFDNKLVVVESDFLALSSVLRGLDVLVTPDTSVKHLADLNEVKVVEYTHNLETTLKQGSRGKSNIIIDLKDNSLDLILNSIKFLIDPTDSAIKKIWNKNVYFTFDDQLGWNLRPINGEFSTQLLKRQLKRTYIANWCDITLDWDIKKYFSDYNYSEVQTIIDEEKNFIGEVSRDLLGTLRSLVKASESKAEANNFVVSLDKLLNHCDKDLMGSIPVSEFKALLENLDRTSNQEQLRSAEELLYKLKKNLQMALTCLNTVEKDARSMPISKKGKSETFNEVTA